MTTRQTTRTRFDAAGWWGARAASHLDRMRQLLEAGRPDAAAQAAAQARWAAIYAATSARIEQEVR